MSTRSSARLRDRVSTEETEGPTVSVTPSRGIVKNEDGEPDEQTLARLKLEADEHRKALAAEKRSHRNNTASTGRSVKRTKTEQDEKESTGQATIKRSKFATKEPVGWKTTLDRIREFRLQNPAPVDTMGCERLAEVGDHIPPEVSRFQTLMALVLSSQTKDTVTSVAVRKLQKELKGGLTIQGVLDVPSDQLNNIIAAVGFHNKKTVFMKQVAEICKTKYNGDIPGTAEELIALPGVGPKMAYLTLQCAWNKNLGIGVDTHVHRIANRLGWIKTEKDGPEATREALQSWLPKEHWREINYLLVGYGQVLCLPRGPLCSACPVQERCPSATGITKQRKKLLAAVKEERQEPFGEVEIHTTRHDANDSVKSEETIIKQEEGEQHPHFSNEGEVDIVVKEEDQDGASGPGIRLRTNPSVNNNLEKEAADIEDLVT
ncbi:DNA glycosylase [Mortierella sp. GBAus27b]|nr:DNA N-glycosylase and apurinic/apyrimidinic (AP) lyase [Mortierella sp. GBA43]KAI8352195.1 DNA glycosylase [Mortierella sp. GBAus27b]